jgi:hypothetical protein
LIFLPPNLLGADAHEVLPIAGDDIGLVFVVTQVAQEFSIG